MPFQPQHAAAVGELIVSIQREEFGFDIDLERQPDLSAIPVYYQHGTGNFWVAMDEQKIVGTVALKDIGYHDVALRKMFVAAEYRGTAWGVAVKLLQGALDWATQHAVHSVFLGTTDKFQAAHRFYEKHGFALIDKVQLPAGFPFMPVDTRFYRLDLQTNTSSPP
ncbi:GNAT family N-acetyltransferase [Dyella nitratireducens]|nr:GNAT family N-acetyltransferase [Dyella nitratireducens]